MADQRTSNSAERDQVEPPPGGLFLTISYLVLFAGGLIAGLVGAFMLPYSVSPGVGVTPTGGGTSASAGHVVAASSHGGLGQLLSVGLLIAIVVNPLLSIAGLRTAGTRLAASTPMLGWLVAVVPMLSTTSDGDSILPNNLRSVAFVLLGATAFVAVILLGRPTRGRTASLSLTGAPPAPPRPPIRSGSGSRPAATKPGGRGTAPKRSKRR